MADRDTARPDSDRRSGRVVRGAAGLRRHRRPRPHLRLPLVWAWRPPVCPGAGTGEPVGERDVSEWPRPVGARAPPAAADVADGVHAGPIGPEQRHDHQSERDHAEHDRRRDHRSQERRQQRCEDLGAVGHVVAQQPRQPDADGQIEHRRTDAPGAGSAQNRRPIGRGHESEGGSGRSPDGENRHQHLQKRPNRARIGDVLGGQIDGEVDVGGKGSLERRHGLDCGGSEALGERIEVEFLRRVALAQERRMAVGERCEHELLEGGILEHPHRGGFDHTVGNRHVVGHPCGQRSRQVLGELGPDLVVVEQLLGDLAGTVGIEHGPQRQVSRPGQAGEQQRHAQHDTGDGSTDHRVPSWGRRQQRFRRAMGAPTPRVPVLGKPSAQR